MAAQEEGQQDKTYRRVDLPSGSTEKEVRMKCKICGSMAINHHLHARDGSDPDLCDVCFWRNRANILAVEVKRFREMDEEIKEILRERDLLT